MTDREAERIIAAREARETREAEGRKKAEVEAAWRQRERETGRRAPRAAAFEGRSGRGAQPLEGEPIPARCGGHAKRPQGIAERRGF